jgi:hypothetical protein
VCPHDDGHCAAAHLIGAPMPGPVNELNQLRETVNDEKIALSPFALRLLIDSVWNVARRSISVGIAEAVVGGVEPFERHPARPDEDRDAGARPEPIVGRSPASEDRLVRGVAPTAGPSALRVASQVRAWHDAASAETSYGLAQRRAYRNVLQLLGCFDEASGSCIASGHTTKATTKQTSIASPVVRPEGSDKS